MAMVAETDLGNVSQLIRQSIPDVDDAIVEYVVGYLDETPSVVDGEDAISDFIRPILLDAGGDEEGIHQLCEKLSKFFAKVNDKPSTNGLAKLDQPVNMLTSNSISATARLAASSIDLESVSGRKVGTRVDTKKLEKAEAKIKAKME